MINKDGKFEVEFRGYWKPVYWEGKKTRYMVSYDGQIYDTKKQKIVKAHKDKRNGYMNYTFCDEGSGLYGTKRVHRIIAKTFIPNPADFPVVNHLDNDRTNNRVDNLEWTTQSENIRYALNQGRLHIESGETHPFAKYTDEQIREVCELLQAGYTNTEIGKMTDVNTHYVSGIRNRQWRKDISKDYTWEIIKFKDRKGSKAYGATIDEAMARKICQMIVQGYQNKEIADKLGVKRHIVKNIRCRDSWKSVSRNFKW